MTEKQTRMLKQIGKVAAYTALTGGSYLLARGALSLLLRKMEPRERETIGANTPAEKAQSA